MTWRSHNSIVANDDYESFSSFFCVLLFLSVFSFLLFLSCLFSFTSFFIHVFFLNSFSKGFPNSFSKGFLNRFLNGSVHYWLWSFLFWHSYFIKLFNGGLQCEFIRTFLHDFLWKKRINDAPLLLFSKTTNSFSVLFVMHYVYFLGPNHVKLNQKISQKELYVNKEIFFLLYIVLWVCWLYYIINRVSTFFSLAFLVQFYMIWSLMSIKRILA